jgi:hypothetical protein
MTGAVFASTYLDLPSGLLAISRPAMRDNASGDPGKPRFLRPKVADALRRARRNSAMGMSDANAVATIPAYLIKRLTQASNLHDINGTMICPNILTDFQAMTAPGSAPA